MATGIHFEMKPGFFIPDTHKKIMKKNEKNNQKICMMFILFKKKMIDH